jgi:hypothetical protein
MSMPAARSPSESAILRSVLQRLGSRPDVRLFRANVGAGRTFAGDAIKWGVKGQADLNGWIMGGRRLEVEVKRPGEKQTQEQKNWQAVCERFGVLYLLVHSADEAEALLEAAL